MIRKKIADYCVITTKHLKVLQEHQVFYLREICWWWMGVALMACLLSA